MREYEVTLGKGGSGTFKIRVFASSPDAARDTAEHMYPEHNAQSVRTLY